MRHLPRHHRASSSRCHRHQHPGPAALRAGLLLSLSCWQVACAGAHESGVRRDLAAAREQRLAKPAERRATTDGSGAVTPDGQAAGSGGAPTAEAAGPAEPAHARGLPAYLRWALERNPAVRAAFARWEASVHRISRARRLPEPTIGFGYFLSSVETRVGPQQARLSLKQAFPWPSKLSAGADAMSAKARATQARFDAQALRVAQQVAEAYWTLWQIRSTRSLHEEHLNLIRGLSETVRARIATGAATLADQQQIDLTAARVADSIRAMDEAELAAAAKLRATIGLGAGHHVPTPQAPADAAVPAQKAKTLDRLVRNHPFITSFAWMAEAQESTARVEAADRLPSFSLGADWIITGESKMPEADDSGKDALVLGAGLRLPLWQGSYSDSEASARAEAVAQRFEQRAASDRALAELESAMSAVRDGARRVHLYGQTLLPQAEAAYASVLGAYATGRGTVAQTLLAQRDLLELRVQLDRARADHARGWARLDQVAGQPLNRTPFVPSERSQETEHESQTD